MGLWEQARSDLRRITTGLKDFAVPVIFTPPGGPPVTVNAVPVKTHLDISMETGLPANVRQARVTVAEATLAAAGYPLRNSAGEVSLTGHLVQFTDATGAVGTYIIAEWFPDEMLGLILCHLRDFEE